jgi:hypothetical protein
LFNNRTGVLRCVYFILILTGIRSFDLNMIFKSLFLNRSPKLPNKLQNIYVLFIIPKLNVTSQRHNLINKHSISHTKLRVLSFESYFNSICQVKIDKLFLISFQIRYRWNNFFFFFMSKGMACKEFLLLVSKNEEIKL